MTGNSHVYFILFIFESMRLTDRREIVMFDTETLLELHKLVFSFTFVLLMVNISCITVVWLLFGVMTVAFHFHLFSLNRSCVVPTLPTKARVHPLLPILIIRTSLGHSVGVYAGHSSRSI